MRTSDVHHGKKLSRVQVKTSNGARWLTVSIREGLQLIRDVKIDMSRLENKAPRLCGSHGAAPHSQMALGLVEDIYEYEGDLLYEFCVVAWKR